jgi:hypothetical protein
MEKEILVSSKDGFSVYSIEDIAGMMIVDENDMIRINGVANAAGKKVSHWLGSKRAEKLQEQLKESKVGIPVVAKQGGVEAGGGTWIHKKLGHSFLMWCFPEYELMVNEILDELFKSGSVSLVDTNLAVKTPELDCMEEWGKRSAKLSEIFDLMGYSGESKRKAIVEAGDRLERDTGVLFMPSEIKRPLMIGTETPDDESVAVVAFGGKTTTVTEIGKRFNVKGKDINEALIKLGYQDSYKVGDAVKYIPTPKAEKYCVVREFKRRGSTKRYTAITGWKLEFVYNALKGVFCE